MKDDYDTIDGMSKGKLKMDVPMWTSKFDNEEKKTLTDKFNDLALREVIVPAYKEPLNVLRKTLNTLVAQTCAKESHRCRSYGKER